GTRLPSGPVPAWRYIAREPACKGTLTGAIGKRDMSTGQIFLLGAIAGATIFLGLPVGRMRSLSPNARAGLSALATGILIFLFWDVMSNAVEPTEAALKAHSWGTFAELSVLGIVGFVAGLMSLVYYEAWMKERTGRRSSPLIGPGAAAVDEFTERRELD